MNGEPNEVELAGRTYSVTLTTENATRSYFWVACVNNPARSWRAAEVIVGTGTFTCTRCTRHPYTPCIHVAIVRKWFAAQPLEPVPGGA